ncbi:MAG: cation:proton antiporter [Bdellovibrionota bacterium]
MFTVAHLIQDLTIVLGVASLIGLLFQKLRFPSILGYLLAGLIVGPYLPVPLFANPERLNFLSEIGVIAVMFLLGLKFKISKLIELIPVSGFTVLVQVCVLQWIGFSLGQHWGWSQLQSVLLGASLCIPSTMIVSNIYETQNVPAETSQFVFGALIIQDVVAIVLITIMTALTAGAGLETAVLLRTVGNLILAICGMLIGGLLILPKILKSFLHQNNQELLAIIGTAVCFLFAFMSEHLGYSVALGAFIGGIILSESGKSYQLEYLLRPIKNIFVAIFFVSIGMTIDPQQVLEHLGPIVLASALVIVGHYTSVILSSLMTGQGSRKAFTAGASLAQIGEFGFIIAGIGANGSSQATTLQTTVVGVSVITTCLSPILLKYATPTMNVFESMVPQRTRLLFSFYLQFLDELKRPSKVQWGNAPLYRALKWIAVDTLVLLLVLIISLPLIQKYAYVVLAQLGWSQEWPQTLMYVSIAIIVMPFLGLIFYNSRKLSSEVARHILGSQSDRSQPMPSGLLHLISICVFFLVYLLVGIPVMAVVRPFLLGPNILPVFATISLMTMMYIYIRTSDLEIHTRSIVQDLAEFVQGRSLRSYPQPIPEISQNLYQVKSFSIHSGDFGNGKNLLDLDLRKQTGASAIAIHRNDGDVLLPRGKEFLKTDDTLILTGTGESIEKAKEYLRRGRI